MVGEAVSLFSRCYFAVPRCYSAVPRNSGGVAVRPSIPPFQMSKTLAARRPTEGCTARESHPDPGAPRNTPPLSPRETIGSMAARRLSARLRAVGGRVMSLFEFTFALQAIILGLALAQLVVSLNKLVLARERVIWAVQPLLAAGLVACNILLLWTGAWYRQGAETTTIGDIVRDILINLTVFAAASAVLPDETPKGEAVDLPAHFERVRVYFFALFIAPIFAVGLIPQAIEFARTGVTDPANWWENLVLMLGALVCMFIRDRRVNIAILGGLLLWVGVAISGYELKPLG